MHQGLSNLQGGHSMHYLTKSWTLSEAERQLIHIHFDKKWPVAEKHNQ